MAEHEWETVKENARPLRHGYKMSALASLLSSPAKVGGGQHWEKKQRRNEEGRRRGGGEQRRRKKKREEEEKEVD